jgi:hypothetical protein
MTYNFEELFLPDILERSLNLVFSTCLTGPGTEENPNVLQGKRKRKLETRYM